MESDDEPTSAHLFVLTTGSLAQGAMVPSLMRTESQALTFLFSQQVVCAQGAMVPPLMRTESHD